MAPPAIPSIVSEFLLQYDASAFDALWKEQSATFRNFWNTRVMAEGTAPLSEEECDRVIRILDRNGKGNTKQSQAVARTMVAQGAWRRMFNEFRSNLPLGQSLTAILEENDPVKKAALIDQLYLENEGRNNYVTTRSGNSLGALLAAWDPENNLCVISLTDRRALIEFLGLSVPFHWDNSTAGQRIVESNSILREGLRAIGLEGSAVTASRFCYFAPMQALWKGGHTVKRPDKSVSVTVPMNHEEAESPSDLSDEDEIRESLQIQAFLAEIGSRMGLRIWLPKSDRARILKKWTPEGDELLEELPLNYDDTTLKTIEQIDVLWLKRRAIVRAFEVEHTTSVYSGLLRMADLLALQPNMDIKLHIVAPPSRREKVFQEIRRPVFSLLEGKPLSEMCTYLSYDKIRELREERHLSRLSDEVLEDLQECAEEI